MRRLCQFRCGAQADVHVGIRTLNLETREVFSTETWACMACLESREQEARKLGIFDVLGDLLDPAPIGSA